MRHLYDELQVLPEPGQDFHEQQRLGAITRPLLSWYDAHARVLPWREDPSPYRVWISEIMLQQTRVEAVKPYFERFVAALPDVASLARVEDDRLMKLWEGLGYYSRARNLKKAAQMMVEQYHGELPASREELLKLPGIGSYTAGAIASIAFGIAAPAVDGNVLRVITRVLADDSDIANARTKARIEQAVLPVIDKKRPGDYNQALIEIGALVCVPNGEPKCAECPLASMCLCKERGLWRELPVKTRAKARTVQKLTVGVIRCKDLVAIRRRPDHGLLAGLCELPNFDGELSLQELAERFGILPEEMEAVRPLPAAKHIFSHIEWKMAGYEICLRETHKDELLDGSFFVECSQMQERYPLPGAFSAYRTLLERRSD